jgi:DNA-binding NarL/FixJ family response regulator
MKKTIVIVDDHLLIAKAITSIISQFKGYEVLFEAENGQDMIAQLKIINSIPDIVLLDISMPLMDGYETATWLKENHPSIKIIALTMQADDNALIQMFKAGATCYLNKNVHPTELQRALQAISEKGYYYPDGIMNKVMNGLTKKESYTEQAIKLSEREIMFLQYCCTELTYKEIAEKMFCSPRTVESYRDALFEKLEVNTRVLLALYAVKTGIYKL